MKRIGALICFIMMAVSVMAPAAFAATDADNASTGKAGFEVVSSTPEDGAKGVSVENLSVKLYFSKDMVPASNAIEKANARQFKLADKDGNELPIKVYYSHEEEGLMMVVSDNIDRKIQINGDTEYTLTIGKGLKAADGTAFGADEKITFRTLNQKRSSMVYTIMMVVMMAGMIIYTSKHAKKMAEKENQEKAKHQTVNPYKEAKKTGKSIEEIVAKDQQKKAKEAEALAKKKAKDAEFEAELEAMLEEKRKAANKRVSGPKPISAAGSEYKVKVVKTQKPQQKKASTNPKNQTGKQKNKKKK